MYIYTIKKLNNNSSIQSKYIKLLNYIYSLSICYLNHCMSLIYFYFFSTYNLTFEFLPFRRDRLFGDPAARDVTLAMGACYAPIIRHVCPSPEPYATANLMQNCETTSTFAQRGRRNADWIKRRICTLRRSSAQRPYGATMHCWWVHTHALYRKGVEGWGVRGEGRRGCRGRGEDFVISVTPFGRCIMSVAVLGNYWQADPTIFARVTDFFAGALAARRRLGICSLRELLFRKKEYNGRAARGGRESYRQWEALGALPKTHDGETADRFRSQLPLIRAGFVHPFLHR